MDSGKKNTKEKSATDVKKVFLASLYRFGYDLYVVGRTEKEAKDAIKEAYIQTYMDWNDGEKPSAHEKQVAFDEIFVSELAFGEVELR